MLINWPLMCQCYLYHGLGWQFLDPRQAVQVLAWGEDLFNLYRSLLFKYMFVKLRMGFEKINYFEFVNNL